MKPNRTRAVCMYTPEAEHQLMKSIASSQHLSLSELVRRCTFTNYIDRSAKIRGDDCLDFFNTSEAVKNTIEEFCRYLPDIPIYQEKSDELISISEQIHMQTKFVYQNLEKIRTRIRKYATKKMLDAQVAFAEIGGMKGSRVSNSIPLSENEFLSLKKMSDERGKSMSEILRMNVIGSCLAKEIRIDSYPLDGVTADMKKHLRTMQAITWSAIENEITQEDIANMLSFTHAVKEIIDSIEIPMEQKDTRREANRIAEGGNK